MLKKIRDKGASRVLCCCTDCGKESIIRRSQFDRGICVCWKDRHYGKRFGVWLAVDRVGKQWLCCDTVTGTWKLIYTHHLERIKK